MKKNNIIVKRLSQFLIIAILIFCIVVGGQLSLSAYTTYAEDVDIVSAYEERNVLDDLEGSTLRDESFDLIKFPLNANGSTSLLSLVEFGYDFDFKYCDDYGLYIYVYNPQALKFFVNSEFNRISLRFGTDKSQHFKKYNLQFLNFSDKSGFYHLFYKFKVLIDKSELQQIHGILNSSKRVYEVGEVELLSDESGLPKAFSGRTFEYSGYAQGYGPEKTAPSSLSITSFAEETLQLDVESTYYRPPGNNGVNEYTQDTLHSVYFAVPNNIIAKYGEMVAVHATWYDAVLKPALITGNKAVLTALNDYLYQDIGKGTYDLPYYVIGDFSHGSQGSADPVYNVGFNYNAYNRLYDYSYWVNEVYGFDYELSTLFLMFDCGSGENSAKNFCLDSKSIINEMYKATNFIQGEKFAGFSTALFESISEEYDKTIRKDDEHPLTSMVLNQSWWDRFWGNEYEDLSDKYSHIKAIQKVTDSDLLSSSDSVVSENLFIAESDVENLRHYYDLWGDNHTIYLFRYQVSPYISQSAYNCKDGDFLGMPNIDILDNNAYFFQMTANLLFDVIDVTFNDGEKDTVIPVAMSPINIIHDATPPLKWDDGYNNNSWKLILGLILLILLLVLLAPVLPVVLRGAVAVIRLPFDLIRSISDLFKKNNRRR